MGSTRLPGKVLADLGGRPMLARVVRRAALAPGVDRVLVATTTDPGDDPVAEFLAGEGIPCFRGSEDDVLDRYFQAARSCGADPVVRVTADCPLIDPDVLGAVVATFRGGEFDYVSNTLERTYPVGLDVEVFSFAALARAHAEARLASEREHVTPYIWKHPTRFRHGQVRGSEDHSALRWVVDHPADLEYARAIYAGLGMDPLAFRMADVLALLARDPALRDDPRTTAVDEGYQRSLREDREVDP